MVLEKLGNPIESGRMGKNNVKVCLLYFLDNFSLDSDCKSEKIHFLLSLQPFHKHNVLEVRSHGIFKLLD